MYDPIKDPRNSQVPIDRKEESMKYFEWEKLQKTMNNIEKAMKITAMKLTFIRAKTMEIVLQFYTEDLWSFLAIVHIILAVISSICLILSWWKIKVQFTF